MPKGRLFLAAAVCIDRRLPAGRLYSAPLELRVDHETGAGPGFAQTRSTDAHGQEHRCKRANRARNMPKDRRFIFDHSLFLFSLERNSRRKEFRWAA